ncbi:DUF7305 domain-containing protein [Kosmotoga pacifica]|uniref:DUF7305 domain-containing protein n=1 Tax=Kosmotoga pacifica TaxID=1330330 RepID=UPI00069B1A79|nr:prepilin-type N-terminal cleavage/methylation domain-containing protein [Kosmotoga pacifica]
MVSARRGFSLVELLISLVALSTLVAIIIPMTMNMIKNAKAIKVATNFKVLCQSVANTVYLNSEVPTSIDELGRNINAEKYGIAWRESDGYYEFVIFTSENVDVLALGEKLTSVSGAIPPGDFNFVNGGLNSFDDMTACYTFLLDEQGNILIGSTGSGDSDGGEGTGDYGIPAFPTFPEGLPYPEDQYVEKWGHKWYWLKDGVLRTRWTPTEEYIIDADGFYSKIEVIQNRKLVIDTGSAGVVRKIRVNTLNVQQGKITLIGSGKVEIYVDNYFNISGSSQVNFNGDAERMSIYYKGPSNVKFGGNIRFSGTFYSEYAEVEIAGSAQFKGLLASVNGNLKVAGAGTVISDFYSVAVYAPDADVTISGGGSVYGTVIGRMVIVSGGGFAENIIETGN